MIKVLYSLVLTFSIFLFFGCGGDEAEEALPIDNITIKLENANNFPDAYYNVDIMDISGKVIKSISDVQGSNRNLRLENGNYKISIQSKRSNPISYHDYLFHGISEQFEVNGDNTVNIIISLIEEEFVGWVQVPNVPIYGINGLCSFILNNVIYIGFGMDSNTITIKSWWSYSLTSKEWNQIDDFPGPSRAFATSFTLKDKGYVCLGLNESGNLNDLYEFDPITENWSKRANFPGTMRDGVASMVIGDYAYIGTGISNGITSHKDFYRYDPVTNEWSQISDYLGEAAYGVSGVGSVSEGHALCGVVNNDERTNFHYKYIPETNTWSKLADFTGEKRLEGISFQISGDIYFGLGSIQNSLPGSDLWKYNKNDDTWERVTDFIGTSRFAAIYGSNGDLGYYGLGNNQNNFSDLYLYFEE